MSRHLILVTAIVSIACSLFALSAEAHPFHSSAAEMEWNPKSHCFEVSWKVDPNDFEQELRRRTKKSIVLEKMANHDAVFKYLNSVFSVELQGKRATLKPIGFEVNSKDAWIYFEVPVGKTLRDMKITNRLLLTSPRQTNTLLVHQGKQRLSFSFTEQKQTRHLKWNVVAKKFELKDSSSSKKLK